MKKSTIAATGAAALATAGIAGVIAGRAMRPRANNESLRNWFWPFETASTSSGIRVDSNSALQTAAVLACVRVISETIASLPLLVYREIPSGGKDRAKDYPLYDVLHERPNRWQTAFEWKETMAIHLCLRGNAYSLIEPGEFGAVTELIPLHPDRMKVERLSNGRLRYTYTEPNGSPKLYTQDQIHHWRIFSENGYTGRSFIQMARESIGLAMSAEKHGSTFFRNNARPGIVLQTEAALPRDTRRETREEWERVHGGSDNANKTAVLSHGLTIKEIGMTNADSQFLETRKYQNEDIARIFRVPLHMIGDLARSTNNNIEQQSLEFVVYTMMPHFVRIQEAIDRDLIVDDGYFSEFLIEGLLRGDSQSRAQFHKTLFEIGVRTVNEIRAIENLNPIGPDGDKRFVPMNMTTLERAGEEIPEAPAPAPGGDGKPPGDDPEDDIGAETEAEKNSVTELTDDIRDMAGRMALAQRSAEAVLNSQFSSLCRWEADAIRRAAKKPDEFLSEIDAFYAEHQSRIEAKISGPSQVLSDLTGHKIEFKALAAQHVENSRQAILRSAECSPAQLLESVEMIAGSLEKTATFLEDL